MSVTPRPLRSTRDPVLADTSAFYAAFDVRAADHTRVTRTFQQLTRDRVRIVITNHVRAETHALILNRLGRHHADRFLAQLRSVAPGTLIFATEADEERALAIITQYRDKEWSLVDCISFAVMERLGITHALTLDHNFEQYGLTIL